jgi:hypothetical protein
MTSFVRIALIGAGSFAKMEIRAGDDISDLAMRASVDFPHWGTADRLTLYLVAAGGKDEPTEEAINAALSNGGRLGMGLSLEDAGISSGAWLVARKFVGGAASCPFFAHAYAPTRFLLNFGVGGGESAGGTLKEE